MIPWATLWPAGASPSAGASWLPTRLCSSIFSGRRAIQTVVLGAPVTPWSRNTGAGSSALSTTAWSFSLMARRPSNRFTEPMKSATKRELGYS